MQLALEWQGSAQEFYDELICSTPAQYICVTEGQYSAQAGGRFCDIEDPFDIMMYLCEVSDFDQYPGQTDTTREYKDHKRHRRRAVGYISPISFEGRVPDEPHQNDRLFVKGVRWCIDTMETCCVGTEDIAYIVYLQAEEGPEDVKVAS